MKRTTDRTLLLIGPLVMWAVGILFFNVSFLLDGPTLGWDFRFAANLLFNSYVTWLLVRWVVLVVERRYPALENTRQRVTNLCALAFPAALILVLERMVSASLFLPDTFNLRAWRLSDYFGTYGMNLYYVTVIAAVYESRYFFQAWLASKRKAEELGRANLEMQLNSLKTQVQPHFLFNSLNTLQALVRSAENERAVGFIGSLSQVYRYLLQSNETQLITLEKELEFVRAYFNLLKTRFDEGLKLDVNINPQCRTYRLPPLTLQLLVENAVKHNVASASRPLTIDVCSNGSETLVVRNNLQPKPRNGVISERKGLYNITAKYRLMNQPDVHIWEEDGAFVVKIPLIKPDTSL